MHFQHFQCCNYVQPEHQFYETVTFLVIPIGVEFCSCLVEGLEPPQPPILYTYGHSDFTAGGSWEKAQQLQLQASN